MDLNPIDVQKNLKGVSYPASRDKLVAEAERHGADDRVRVSLARLPWRRFESPAEVSEALGGENA